MAMKYATPREFATATFTPYGEPKGLGEMEFAQYMEGTIADGVVHDERGFAFINWQKRWCWVRFDDSPHGTARLLSEKEAGELGLTKGGTP